MPSLQNIESFKQLLNEIGDEPAILEELGQAIEDVTPPEAEDLSGLFDDETGLSGMDLVDEGAQDSEPSVPPNETTESPSFGNGLDDELGSVDDDFPDGFDDELDISDIFPTDSNGVASSVVVDDTDTTAEDDVLPEPDAPGTEMSPDAIPDSFEADTSSPVSDDFSFPEDTQFESPVESRTESDPFDAVDFDDAFFGEDAKENASGATGSVEEIPVSETPQESDIGTGIPAEEFSFDQPLFDESNEASTPAEVTASETGIEPGAGADDFDLDGFEDLDEVFEPGEVVASGAEDPEEPPTELDEDDFETAPLSDSAGLGDIGEVEADDASGADVSDELVDDFDIDFDSTDFDAADLASPDFEADDVDDVEDVEELTADGSGAGEIDDFSMPDDVNFDDTGVEGGEEVLDTTFDAGEDEFSVPEEFSFDDETDSLDPASLETIEDGDALTEDDGFSFAADATDSFAIPGDEVADEALEATDEDDFDLDDFSLGDIGEEFGLTEDVAEELPAEEEPSPANVVGEPSAAADDALDLTDAQFAALQDTLNIQPRNLRLIVEELIGEEQLAGDDLRKLVDALVRGRSSKEIAAIAGAITGEKIVIPSQYEKRTGVEFEEERGTLAYIFKHNILPVLRIVGTGVAALLLIGFLGYRFIYRPIKATSFYQSGYTKLEDGNYLRANEDFDRGVDLWNRKVWYYRYADGYRERRREDLAAQKYDELLGSFPDDRNGLLDYADLETYERARYEHAEQLLRRLLDNNAFDYDALLLLGDTYTEWAREAPEKHENARYSYATLLEKYGNRDEVMQRMLRYFIRTDDSKEVRRLTDYFQNLEDADIDPYIYAELGGYYIDRNELDDVKPILFRALDEDKFIADVHYNLARYFRKVDDIAEESRALTNAYGLLQNDDLLTVDEERMLIDTIARQGEVAYRRDQYLEAQSRFIDALDLYEDALERGRFTQDPMFGRIYAALGDVFYYIAGQSEPALHNYLEAERNDFIPPEIRYKIGNIRYRDLDYDEALIKFYQAAGDYSSNVNLMYATANTLYERGNFSAAQGYFLHILDELETTRRNIPILRPEEREDHRALIENLMRTYNNLGATLYRLSVMNGEESKRSRSLAYLTRSSEFFDRLTRDRETLVRTESKNLSYLNTRSILYPTLDFDVTIYKEIPRDMAEFGF
jgi:tetratricopeptide (TPR) repeat protein